MTDLVAGIVIVGIPFTLSLGWFLFWVQRIRNAAKKKKPLPNPPAGTPEVRDTSL